jgi:hypothetical protein
VLKSRLSDWFNPIIHPHNPDKQRRAKVANQLQIRLGLIIFGLTRLGILCIFANKVFSLSILGARVQRTARR